MLIKFLEWTGRPPEEFKSLIGADLSGADLLRANLSEANLIGADLSWADLSWADLLRANLLRANLSGADLSRANLSVADLSEANLSEADLSGADLSRANLSGADLRVADLRGANLSVADLRGANLSWADLRWANLYGAKGLEQQIITPEGMLKVYKKLDDGQIATLIIPGTAKRVNAYGSRKCRSSEAFVLKMGDKTCSKHDHTFIYEQGKTVRPTEPFNEDPRIECGSGIHWFLTRAEAQEYD
jgi:hypothetical protein